MTRSPSSSARASWAGPDPWKPPLEAGGRVPPHRQRGRELQGRTIRAGDPGAGHRAQADVAAGSSGISHLLSSVVRPAAALRLISRRIAGSARRRASRINAATGTPAVAASPSSSSAVWSGIETESRRW